MCSSAAGAAQSAAADEQPAVTLSIAKRPGANAISVAHEVLKKVDALKGRVIPNDVADRHHPPLRRDGGGEIQRAAAAHGHRGDRRVAAHPADAGLARVGHRRHRHSLHAGPDAAGVLPLRLHAQPHHALRADLLHRHPGGRRHRRGREHRPALPPAPEQGPPLVGDRRRGGQRSRQSDHPRHLRRDRGGAADGLCRRPDGALHAADSHRVQRRHVLVAGHRLHRHALGGDPHPALGPEIFAPHRGRRGRG